MREITHYTQLVVLSSALLLFAIIMMTRRILPDNTPRFSTRNDPVVSRSTRTASSLSLPIDATERKLAVDTSQYPQSRPRTGRNPTLDVFCYSKIIVLVDSSGSTNSNIEQVRNTVHSLVYGMTNQQTEVAIIDYDDVALLKVDYHIVSDDTMFYYDDYVDGFYPGGNTNWDDALYKANLLNEREQADNKRIAELIIFITDGTPNRGNADYERGPSNAGEFDQYVWRAIDEANSLKKDGSRIVCVGFDEGVKVDDLVDICGPNVFDDTGSRTEGVLDILTTDVVRTSVENLEDRVSDLFVLNCPSAPPTVSIDPSSAPSDIPSLSLVPSSAPSDIPSLSMVPSSAPSDIPSLSMVPSSAPSDIPSLSMVPSLPPSILPTVSLDPSKAPSDIPSASNDPSIMPSDIPSVSMVPSLPPSILPTVSLDPSNAPSDIPSLSNDPSIMPSDIPSLSIDPSSEPSDIPSLSISPSHMPTEVPSVHPTAYPTPHPTRGKAGKKNPKNRRRNLQGEYKQT